MILAKEKLKTHSFGVTKVTEGAAGNGIQSELVRLAILVKAICYHSD